jgi:hypothetical protein
VVTVSKADTADVNFNNTQDKQDVHAVVERKSSLKNKPEVVEASVEVKAERRPSLKTKAPPPPPASADQPSVEASVASQRIELVSSKPSARIEVTASVSGLKVPKLQGLESPEVVRKQTAAAVATVNSREKKDLPASTYNNKEREIIAPSSSSSVDRSERDRDRDSVRSRTSESSSICDSDAESIPPPLPSSPPPAPNDQPALVPLTEVIEVRRLGPPPQAAPTQSVSKEERGHVTDSKKVGLTRGKMADGVLVEFDSMLPESLPADPLEEPIISEEVSLRHLEK